MANVEIFEVGPRDGLQNEKHLIPTPDKVALVNCLSRAGFRRIEVASFVSPKWVPQMADSADVLAQIARADGVRYAALVPICAGLKPQETPVRMKWQFLGQRPMDSAVQT